MKPPRLFIASSLLAALIVGCVSTPSPLTPVKDSTTRVELSGYSILPPEGKNWHRLKQSEGSIVFMKRLEAPTNSFSAAVLAAPFTMRFNSPEEFREFVAQGKQKITDPNRFSILEYNDSIDTRFGPYGVQYSLKVEDRNAQVSRVETRFMILEVIGNIFIHPDSPDLVIDVQYSQRYIKGTSEAGLKQVGEKFIDGFQVAPLERTGVGPG